MRDGQFVPLEEQDRTLWDADMIREGTDLLHRALALKKAGAYQIQAAIAAIHANAATPDQTDWAEIAALYERLLQLSPSPIIALNYAVALALSSGLEQGLNEMDRLAQSSDLESYYLFHAARADILRRLGRRDEALNSYREAISLTENAIEQDYLRRRMSALQVN